MEAYFSMLNIDPAIKAHALALGLDGIATGGGCDYIFKEEEDGTQIILTGAYDPDPEGLDAPASLAVYRDDSWMDGVAINFSTAREALEFMAGHTFSSF